MLTIISRNLLQTVSTASAVLDLHFSPHRPEILAVAISTGAIEIYGLSSAHVINLELLQIVQAFDPNILVLSLAWHPSPERSTELAVSLSDGNVALIDHSETPAVKWIEEAHSLEAWTVSWSYIDSTSDDSFLYSGGDDSGLRTFLAKELSSNIRANNGDPEGAASTIVPVFNTKIHGAGVTAILPIKHISSVLPETLLTGSYDEYIRVLALSPRGIWMLLAEKRLGGGVWRLKQIVSLEKNSTPSPTESSFYILASCMHAGARVLKICKTGEGTWSIKVLYKFEEHESMNYGSDATMLPNREGGLEPTILIASTSFYDRRLCLWSIPSPGNVPITQDPV
ncbi:hypothetical protein MMC18_001807 [Xylographa bjoerkii]|nr:hypothetical protein [Xylographa bjoerkii]